VVRTEMRRKGKRVCRAALIAALVITVMAQGAAAGEWLAVEDAAPENADFLVQDEYSGTVCITFLGDCTLGGEEKTRNAARGFFRTVEKNGMDWPFRNLTALTAGDDLTVANLEGVLSDRDLPKVPKEYNFIGPTAYTEILRKGSVECVTLANNHSHDYDNAGYQDTQKALEAAGTAWFGTERALVWKNGEGLMIGFLGVSGSLSGNRAKDYEKKARILREMGCAAVITVMHAGTEYEAEPDGYQNQIVTKAVRCGSDLVIGHHPHIVQGYEIREGVPVVYSLGNCVFGGNGNPRDHDALAVRAELKFSEGELVGITLRLYPISVSGEKSRNDYSPVLLTGADAERVLRKMAESTGNDPGAFDETEGAVVEVSVK